MIWTIPVSQISTIVRMCVTAMLLFKPIGTIVMVMVWEEKTARIFAPLISHSDGYLIMKMKMIIVIPIIMIVREYVMDLHR
jgi:hypothetical protein